MTEGDGVPETAQGNTNRPLDDEGDEQGHLPPRGRRR
jgi:hypothetical protein